MQWPDRTTYIADLLLLSGGERANDFVQEVISRLHALRLEIILKCSIGLIRNAFELGLMRLRTTARLAVLAESISANVLYLARINVGNQSPDAFNARGVVHCDV
jgi:hypothetical protein